MTHPPPSAERAEKWIRDNIPRTMYSDATTHDGLAQAFKAGYLAGLEEAYAVMPSGVAEETIECLIQQLKAPDAEEK